MFIFLKKFLCNVYIYMYRETDIYIYMVKNVYRYNCACARVRFSIQNVYTFGTKGPQKCIHFGPKVHTLPVESVCTFGRKCMSFLKVYALMARSVCLFEKCIHFWP